jgi:hypothetical protein
MPAPRALAVAVGLGVLLLAPGAAPGQAARLERDPRADLQGLAQSAEAAVAVRRADGLYVVDASAVVRASAERLLTAAVAYERHVAMGMPHLWASHVVDTDATGHRLHVWTSLRCLGVSSSQYLVVQIRREVGLPGAAVVTWQLMPRRAEWPHPAASAFRRLEGWLYLEPRADGMTYVRYFGVAALDLEGPETVIGPLVARQLTDGTREMLGILAREAATVPPAAISPREMATSLPSRTGPGGS